MAIGVRRTVRVLEALDTRLTQPRYAYRCAPAVTVELTGAVVDAGSILARLNAVTVSVCEALGARRETVAICASDADTTIRIHLAWLARPDTNTCQLVTDGILRTVLVLAALARCSIGEAAIGQAAIGQATVGQATVGQAAIGQTRVRQAPVGQTRVRQASVG